MKSYRKAFTLIELLVVISIIAVLMAIMMPALSRARESSKRIMCMNNLKGFTVCWSLYAQDNNDKIPSGRTNGAECWVNHAGLEIYQNAEDQTLAIKKGLLWQYTQNVEFYGCPNTLKGDVRSYSMPDSFAQNSTIPITAGANKSMVVYKMSQLLRPGERMVFVDEGFASSSTWSIFYYQQRWWDPVPLQHSDGTTMSFGDGHSEYWKWQDSRTIEFGKAARALENPNEASYWRERQRGNQDITRIVKAVWGKIGWEEE